MEDAVRQLSQTVDPEKLQELDAKIQSLILEKFTGLAHVCLTSANLLDDVQAAMQKEAESFVGGSIAAYNIAEMYLAQVGDDTQAAEKMLSAFNEAAPPFCSQEIDQQPKVNILGVPGGPAGDRVREIVRQALTNVQLTITTTANDILFYREISQLPISALAQLGPHAYEAYKQISGAEHFTAHSRSDILEWRAATAS